MKKRKICSVVLVAVILLLSLMPVYDVKAENIGDIMVSNFDFKLNDDSNVVDDITVKDGDRLSISFAWKIENTDELTKKFVVDLQEKSHKIKIEDVEQSDIPNSSGVIIGKYNIQDGKMYIVLNDEYLNDGSEKRGGARIDGVISTGLVEENRGETVQIGIGDSVYNVVYGGDSGDNLLSVKKTASGTVKRTGDTLTQTFEVKLLAESGTVKNVSLMDEAGNGLSDISSIKVKESNVTGISEGAVYSDMASLNAALSGLSLNKNDKIVLEYTMNVDKDIVSDQPVKSYKNKINASYIDNDTPKNVEDDAEVDYKKPEVSKSGYWQDKEAGIIKWTIKVNLNSYNDPAKGSFSNYNVLITDEPEFEWYVGNFPNDISATDFECTNQDEGEYTYSYETKVKDSYFNLLTATNLKNTAKIKLDWDNYITNFSDEGIVVISPKMWLTKKAIGYDYDKHQISWKITMNPLPAGITDVEITDSTYKWNDNEGTHSLTGSIYVESENERKCIVDENGNLVAGNGVVTEYNNGTLKFNNAYIASRAGKKIDIYCISQITDSDEEISEKSYRNRVDIKYNYDGEEKTGNTSAFWNKSRSITKKGEKIQGENQVKYTVSADLSNTEMTAGQELVLTDTLPDGMKLESESVFGIAFKDGNKWSTVDINTKEENNQVKFTIKMTDEMLSQQDCSFIVQVYYTLGLKDERQFVLDGKERTFKNYVRGTFDGRDIGDSIATVTLKPCNIVTKNATYSLDTAPYIDYEIRVNPDRADMSDGKLKAKDKLGSALSYDLDSITVQKYENWKWVDLKRGKDYSYALDADKNEITFTLPDETYVRICYRAKVNLYISEDASKNGVLTEENSGNSFKIEGFEQKTVSDYKSFACTAITPRVWGNSEFGSIDLLKYWNDDDNMTTLTGCTFKLERCHYDEISDKMVADSVVESDIEVNENGRCIVNNLLYDRIYRLVETKAPDGFEISDRPYYFVITGSAGVTLPENISVRQLSSGSIMAIENYPSEEFYINLKKSRMADNGDSGDSSDISNQGIQDESAQSDVSTGDNTNYTLWIIIAVVSACCICAGVVVYILRKKKKD